MSHSSIKLKWGKLGCLQPVAIGKSHAVDNIHIRIHPLSHTCSKAQLQHSFHSTGTHFHML